MWFAQAKGEKRVNNRVFYYVLFIMFLFICTSVASERVQHNQQYFLVQNGETLIDGSQVYMRYDVTLLENKNKANIKLTTWHAPISCEGDYTVENNNGEYALSYSGDSDGCMYPPPQFYIMKKGGDVYIKGEPLVYGQDKWLKLSWVKR